MIKKGGKIVVTKPLKVLEVMDGDYLRTVLVKISFRSNLGITTTHEVELPRTMVKEYKKSTNSLDNLYILAEDLFVNGCLDALKVFEGLVLDQFNELSDNEKWDLIDKLQSYIKDLEVES